METLGPDFTNYHNNIDHKTPLQHDANSLTLDNEVMHNDAGAATTAAADATITALAASSLITFIMSNVSLKHFLLILLRVSFPAVV
uniref:Uncharacterized protein n=1 Tax=Glossina morsitans morsitans TaxID=37546 RepID=A0A1B0FNC3_GLOMM